MEFDATAFERDGFFSSDSLIDATTCKDISAQLDGLENRAGQRHLIDHPAVTKLLANQALVNLIRVAIGDNAFAYKATLFDKSTDANWLVCEGWRELHAAANGSIVITHRAKNSFG